MKKIFNLKKEKNLITFLGKNRKNDKKDFVILEKKLTDKEIYALSVMHEINALQALEEIS